MPQRKEVPRARIAPRKPTVDELERLLEDAPDPPDDELERGRSAELAEGPGSEPKPSPVVVSLHAGNNLQREKQTVYLSRSTRLRLKLAALHRNCELSDLVEEALLAHLPAGSELKMV